MHTYNYKDEFFIVKTEYTYEGDRRVDNDTFRTLAGAKTFRDDRAKQNFTNRVSIMALISTTE